MRFLHLFRRFTRNGGRLTPPGTLFGVVPQQVLPRRAGKQAPAALEVARLMRPDVRPVVVPVAALVATLAAHQVTLVDGFVARKTFLRAEALDKRDGNS